MLGAFDRYADQDWPRPCRFGGEDAVGLLWRLQSRGLILRGCVALVRFNAIRARVGEAGWRYVRPNLWRQADGLLGRTLSADGVGLRVNETDWVLAEPEGPAAVQAAGLRLATAAFRRIGLAWRPSDIDIRCVTEIRGEEIGCVPLDPEAIIRSAHGVWRRV